MFPSLPYVFNDEGSLYPIMAQVVGWENINLAMEQTLQLWESYTQCHLDVGPTLQGWLGPSWEVIPMNIGGLRWRWSEVEMNPL